MQTKKAVIIFAKTPKLSPIKTRLAKKLGEKLTLEFYSLSLAAVAELIKAAVAQVTCQPILYIALAEPYGHQDLFWKPYGEDFNFIWTGEGGLGERISNVYSQLKNNHDEVMLLGTDCPQIKLDKLSCLINEPLKDQSTCLIGPSFDGGFYFFRSKADIPKSTWCSVTYSTAETLKELLIELNKININPVFGDQEEDVDELHNLRSISSELNQNESLLPAQKQLQKWLSQRNIKPFLQ